MPYAATGDPHVVTINGQELTPGSGNLAAMLQQITQAEPTGTPPVVMVNGQTSSDGQMVDMSSYLTPEVTQRIASSLQALGLDQSLGAMFGHIAGQSPPPEPLRRPGSWLSRLGPCR